MRGKRRDAEQSAVLTAAAEVRAAQERTREIEQARQLAVSNLHAHLERARQTAAQQASALVELTRACGVTREVVQILAPLVGYHEAGTDNCEDYA